MQLKNYIGLFLLFFCVGLVAQEANFRATISKNKLGKNQRLRIQFSIDKQGADNFTPPSFAGFKIVGGPSQSVSQSYTYGKVTFSKTYTYVLEPKRTGELTISPAIIEINGKVLRTKPLKVIVTKAIDLPKDPDDPQYIASQNIHLVAEVSKTRPYVGEGIYVEYRLYVSENVSVYDTGITEAPQYNGFWNQEIKINGYPVKNGTYNGAPYRYIVLQKALLIPTRTGRLSINPMKMDIVIGVPTGRADFFGNAITRNVRRQFASTKKIVIPKLLPTEGKPEGFTGAVGDFNFVVTANKNILKANESSTIKVSVNGKGNLKLFELPKVEAPKELEIYQPERKEKVSLTSAGLRGEVYDNYTVVPEYKGKYKIPKVSFSYFNPKKKKYFTIDSEDLFVDVLAGKELNTNSDANTVVKKDVTINGNNFRYIQTKSNFVEAIKSDFFKSTSFYLLLILPLITIPVGIFIKNEKEKRDGDIVGKRLRKADKLAKKYLFEAYKNRGDKELFYESLERALHNYLKAKLQVETVDISKEKISQLLLSKNIAETDVNEFMSVLKDCDFARYTPSSGEKINAEYENAKTLISKLDKQL